MSRRLAVYRYWLTQYGEYVLGHPTDDRYYLHQCYLILLHLYW